MDREKEMEIKQKIEESKAMVINSIAETMDLYGVAISVGRLYGMMHFQKTPMSLDEMKNELSMSKPSMSKAVRVLSENKMVKKVWQKGSRKDIYSVEKDFFKSSVSFFYEKCSREVAVNLEAISSAEAILEEVLGDDEINGGLKEEAQHYYDQLQETKTYYNWLSRLAMSIKSGELFKYIPVKPGEDTI